MSLVNAHNAHNAHTAQTAQTAQAGSGGASGVDAGTLAQALIVVRDALAPMDKVKVDDPKDPQLDHAARLRRIEFPFAVSALLSELGEGLTVRAGPKAFAISAPRGELVRITPPALDNLKSEAQLVAGYAELRAERLSEVLAQSQHIHPFFSAVLPMVPAWTPGLVLLIAVTEELATAMVQRAKLGFGLPRPHVLSPDILPMIACPGHSSFPSGHAAQSFAVAGVLSALTGKPSPALDNPLDQMAARIAVNRTVAGLHYPCDSAAGAVLGIAVARWVLARAGAASGAGQVSLDAKEWGGDAPDATRDFHLPALCNAWKAKHHLKQDGTLQVTKAPMLASLWTEVTRELGERWG